jgi:hypothetical protein
VWNWSRAYELGRDSWLEVTVWRKYLSKDASCSYLYKYSYIFLLIKALDFRIIGGSQADLHERAG